MARRLTSLAGELLFVLLVGSLVAGQLLGQPVLLGFVETGSMAPTLAPGDGFVAVPSALAGEPEPGDVVTFRAAELNGGGLTTHRIVRETERGYVTRGDANPFTDQSADEPPVKDAQIVAHAVQIGGRVVVLPELGTAVTTLREGTTAVQQWLAVTTGVRSFLGTRGLLYLLVAVSAVGYVFDLRRSSDDARERSRADDRSAGVSTRVILLVLAALVVLAATAAMVVPAGTDQFDVVSAEFASDRPTVVQAGDSATIDYRLVNDGFVPVHVYVEPSGDGVAVDPTHAFLPGRGEAAVAVTLSAPPETGVYRRFVVRHRYLAVVPEPMIAGLAAVHPWLPIVAIDALLGGGLYGLGALLVRDGRVRFRQRESRHDRSLFRRLLRAISRN